MQVIPVIDIRNGVTVRAVAGRRREYGPLVSPLACSSAPLDVARGLMTLHPFRALYIADLDAIEGRPHNRAAIFSISDAFPGLSLWVDAGLSRGRDAHPWLARRNVDAVMGSESLAAEDEVATLRDDPRVILSLDFRGTAFLGPQSLLQSPDLWPARVIVMTLARIGGDEGPDLPRLAQIRARASGKRIFSAGGVRDAKDLQALQYAGAAGALVASALHDGRLASLDLARLDDGGK
jgi:phosphoribosylformimino-5-aminoimidazole carboxamide ribotide isomerase